MDILFWLDGPPICCKGIFDAVADIWDGRVYYVVTKAIEKDRSAIVGDDTCLETSKVKYVYLDGTNDMSIDGNALLEKHKNDMNIFNGYVSNSSKYLSKLLSINRKAKVIIWAERPCPAVLNKNRIERIAYGILHNCRHALYAIKYRNKVTAFCPLGEKGIKAYHKLGWPTYKMFPLLYLPDVKASAGIVMDYENKCGSVPIKFVYLGRFSNGWKGIDLLLDACLRLKNDNYTLDLVGGYGDYKDQTLKYISENKHLTFGGTWKITEVCQKLSEYDVCIVPSRFEGWNVTVNEAIMAGIGCIVTDEAVSDELIANSGAGIIVRSNPVSIAEAMDYIIENPNIVTKYKKLAMSYRKCIEASICANYLVDIINYLLGESETKERPQAPWLGNKNAK